MADFWENLDRMIATRQVVIDRPKGSPHPRYPEFIYPYDYGYLEGTQAVDGGGVDIWRGSLAELRASGVVIAVDLVKNDVELKLLLGCTDAEMREILVIHQQGEQFATFLKRGD